MFKKITIIHIIFAVVTLLLSSLLFAQDVNKLRDEIDPDQTYLFVPSPIGNVKGHEILSVLDSTDILLEELELLRQEKTVIIDTVYITEIDTVIIKDKEINWVSYFLGLVTIHLYKDIEAIIVRKTRKNL